MNIDERLEKLAERHEALTQTVELLAHHGQEQRKLMEQREAMELQRKAIDALLTLARQDGENIRTLAHVAESHERRITKLEGGAQ